MMKGEDAAAENNEQQAQDDAAAETAAAEVAKTDEEQSATKPQAVLDPLFSFSFHSPTSPFFLLRCPLTTPSFCHVLCFFFCLN